MVGGCWSWTWLRSRCWRKEVPPSKDGGRCQGCRCGVGCERESLAALLLLVGGKDEPLVAVDALPSEACNDGSAREGSAPAAASSDRGVDDAGADDERELVTADRSEFCADPSWKRTLRSAGF